jgi:hypothetical protein
MLLISLTCGDPDLTGGVEVAAKFLLEEGGACVRPEERTQWLLYVVVAVRWALWRRLAREQGAYSAGDRTPPVGVTHLFGTIAHGVRLISGRA